MNYKILLVVLGLLIIIPTIYALSVSNVGNLNVRGWLNASSINITNDLIINGSLIIDGNVTASNFIGNGTNLTGVAKSDSNCNETGSCSGGNVVYLNFSNVGNLNISEDLFVINITGGNNYTHITHNGSDSIIDNGNGGNITLVDPLRVEGDINLGSQTKAFTIGANGTWSLFESFIFDFYFLNTTRFADMIVVEASVGDCNGDNEGAIFYNVTSRTHFGCNSTDWNAFY